MRARRRAPSSTQWPREPLCGRLGHSLMTGGKSWIAWATATLAAIVLSYNFVDRPLAYWVHDSLRHYKIFVWMTLPPEWLPPVAVMIVAGLGFYILFINSLSKLAEAALLCSVSLIVTRAAKDQLKVAFGRTWPETWVNNNPSLIHDGVYGFNPFHGGAGFESFPSGHAAPICAVAAILWVYYPHFRVAYLLVAALVMIGLVGTNYHFVSDVIAGAFVGVSVAVFCLSLWRAARQPPKQT